VTSQRVVAPGGYSQTLVQILHHIATVPRR